MEFQCWAYFLTWCETCDQCPANRASFQWTPLVAAWCLLSCWRLRETLKHLIHSKPTQALTFWNFQMLLFFRQGMVVEVARKEGDHLGREIFSFQRFCWIICWNFLGFMFRTWWDPRWSPVAFWLADKKTGISTSLTQFPFSLWVSIYLSRIDRKPQRGFLWGIGSEIPQAMMRAVRRLPALKAWFLKKLPRPWWSEFLNSFSFCVWNGHFAHTWSRCASSQANELRFFCSIKTADGCHLMQLAGGFAARTSACKTLKFASSLSRDELKTQDGFLSDRPDRFELFRPFSQRQKGTGHN